MFTITIINGRIELRAPYNLAEINHLKRTGWKWHGHEGRKCWSIA